MKGIWFWPKYFLYAGKTHQAVKFSLAGLSGWLQRNIVPFSPSLTTPRCFAYQSKRFGTRRLEKDAADAAHAAIVRDSALEACGNKTNEKCDALRSHPAEEFVELVGGIEVCFEFTRPEFFSKVVNAAREKIESGGEHFLISENDIAPR
jgi:hypothetical protein